MICKGCGMHITSMICPYCGTTSEEKLKSEHTTTSVSVAEGGEQVFDSAIRGILEIETRCSSGSGFLISMKGYGLTNAHVVTDDRNDACTEVSVKLNGEKIPTTIVTMGISKGSMNNGIDLAIIKLDYVPSGAKALILDDSQKVRNGERVYAIGNSQGDGTCITSGIVSDKLRLFQGKRYIMTDCAINPGNSGGPLLNAHGNVIGINVMARTTPQGTIADGMKYAITSNEAKKFAFKYLDR